MSEEINKNDPQKIQQAPRSKMQKLSRCIHWFKNPFHIIIMLILLIIILASVLIFGNANQAFFTSRTIDFGLSDIGELATQAGYYTNVNTISKPDRTIGGIPIPGTSSRAIMTYQGVIKAGVNFDQIQTDIDTEKKIVTLLLPSPKILSNEIDLDSCELYDEQSSIFNQINIENYNQSLTEMKSKAETQAKENKILEAAKSNAEILIKTIFNSNSTTEGYELRFVWQEEKGEKQ